MRKKSWALAASALGLGDLDSPTLSENLEGRIT